MNKKIFLPAGMVFILLVTLAAFKHFSPATPSAVSEKPVISTSFYPLYFFASSIVGDSGVVRNITPAGAEPHDYEPTARDVANLMDSDLLILNGAVEPWANKLKNELLKKGVDIVVASDGLITKQFDHDGEMTPDPHVWLDPVKAQEMVKTISRSIAELDPANAVVYESNTKNLLENLKSLDEEYRTSLANCSKDTFITSHAAFQYLAERYNLKQLPISGLSLDAEPSAQELSKIADFAKLQNIKYIFFESLASPKLARTLSQEVGAETLVLNPLEGLNADEVKANENYLTVMKNNLSNLSKALECK